MSVNRILTTILLVTAALSTRVAMAQPFQGPTDYVAKDSFTLTLVDKPTWAVEVYLDPLHNGLWKVREGSAENAAKLAWQVDARCAMRLKSLSVKHAKGTHEFEGLTSATKSLQQKLTLPTFSSQYIGQLCLDIANKTFVTANGDPYKIHELKTLQEKFKGTLETSVTGGLLLSGRCTSPDGLKTVTSVVDKTFPAEIKINCSVTGW